MSDAIDKIEDWCEFGPNRAYILWAVARSKHNEHISNAEEVIYRTALTPESDITKEYHDMVAQINRHDLEFRMYLTVNARDTMQAGAGLQDNMVSWFRELLNGHDEHREKFNHVDSRWLSKLHSSECKDDNYFQIDCDGSKADANALIDDLIENIEVDVNAFKTPNGYHILTEPFNYTEWEPPVEYDELDTDGQLHIEQIDNT